MFFFSTLYAQRYEIGMFAGGNNVVGDVGSGYYVHPNSFSVGGVFKWNIDNRWGFRFNGGFSNAKGDGSSRFSISEGSGPNYKYAVALYNAEALVEWNVFNFNLRNDRYRQTPYATIGIGAINHDTWLKGRKYTVSLPFGVGYKYAITKKWVLAADLMFRYSFTDDLDLTNGKQVGNLNSNDWLTTVGLTLTYVFGRDPCACGQ